jgi:hypothetical protein
LALAISAADIWAKSFARRISRSDIVSRAVISRSGGGGSSRGFGGAVMAWATRIAPGFGLSGWPGSPGAIGDIWAMSFSTRARLRQKMRKACSKMAECSRRVTKTAWSVQ